ncbi:hypothetical protein CRM22_004890 [Opisthorchis felineus]|uniref:MD-2-related lipid-recognition domain-containing protein n=1 Tax=Opisthorchis felineus TaxID=147828 RepID=A0A4S2LTZ4_OPIFE|nr:hypothetical protein CRM22_004890 [Opisthorchis felineus]
MHLLNIMTWELVLCTSSVTDATNYKDCGSANAFALSVEITPCNSDPCVLVTGEPVTVDIMFTATEDIRGGSASMQVVNGNVIRWLPPPNKTLCECLNPSCPIEEGGTHVYRHTLEIIDNIPSHEPEIRLELLNEQKSVFFCIQFPVQINAF